MRFRDSLAIFGLAAAIVLAATTAYSASPKKHSLPTKGETRQQVLQKLYKKLRLASNRENANSIEKAIESVWLESGSVTVNLLMSRALDSQSKKQYTACLKLLNEIVAIAPGYTEGWHRRALVYFERGDYSRAMMDIRQVLALDPRNFQAIHGLGLILQEFGKKKAALKVFRKLLEIHPHFKDAKKIVEQLSWEVEGQET